MWRKIPLYFCKTKQLSQRIWRTKTIFYGIRNRLLCHSNPDSSATCTVFIGDGGAVFNVLNIWLWDLNCSIKPKLCSHLLIYALIFLRVQQGERKSTQKFREQKSNTYLFCSIFSDPPAPQQKSLDIPPKGLFSLGFEGHTELFGPHPFTWKPPPYGLETTVYRPRWSTVPHPPGLPQSLLDSWGNNGRCASTIQIAICLNHFVLIAVCSVEFLVECWRICTGFKAVSFRERERESDRQNCPS